MATHKLTAKAVAAAAFEEKPKKLSDGGGLHLLVNKSGRYWRYSYRHNSKQQTLALGTYPTISLKDARDEHEAARRLLRDGINPSEHRRLAKLKRTTDGENTIEALAKEWLSKQSAWAESHRKKVRGRLEKDVYPTIGHKPIADIQTMEILECLYRMENRGAVDSAHRVKQTLGAVFRYAIQTGRAEVNPIPNTKGALKSPKKGQYPFISEPKRVGELMRAIHSYGGNVVVEYAIKIAPLVFVRPGELRSAEWAEIDLKKARWVIPEHRMKGRRKHTVPLSKQAVKLFSEIQYLTGRGKLVFPGIRSVERPISDNTLNAVLRRLGYGKDEMVAHGFRHMASTMLNERKGFDPDLIEAQLAHIDTSMRGRYNNAGYVEKRAEMMQWWADYLDELSGCA